MLHITAVVAIISTTFGLPVTVFLGVAAVCEFTAIFLLSRKPEDEATDATDVGLRLGCGTIFGLIAVPWTAYVRRLGFAFRRAVLGLRAAQSPQSVLMTGVLAC